MPNNTALTDDLLPCPFCGAKAMAHEKGKGASWHPIIACVNWCCSVSGTGGTRDGMRASAVRLWNTRAAIAASLVEQHEAAPSGMPSPIWWINHGTHGQITTRPDEAERAREAGSSVHKYYAAAQPEPPVADERAAFVEIRKKIELIKGGVEHWPGGWSGTIGACDDVLAELDRASSPNATGAEAARDQKEGRWCPDECPVTGKPFFMWIDHPELGYVPTYGGPYDSYTIAVPDQDGYFRSERYDHDEGSWVEGGAPMRVRRELVVAVDLATAPTQVAIPAGYALVPIERSYDMRAKALIAFNTTEHAGKDRDDALDAAHRATIAAAPQPSATSPSAEG
ncbi:hypothetical protein G3O06_01245 [Burkholderia sp. Ac-20345]|uniref:Lar family restriction alleviation protein n=1 Tax=Burkholderia sp. Ac-20345 TaxID=2703891 RepID=UPI00197C26E7|nr:Lar family restriction alleviation protein [Burkholderia sp. Ac-20345]MBN3776189.1 hypothetical protein [Burkholderia sp. Ac-20345]